MTAISSPRTTRSTTVVTVAAAAVVAIAANAVVALSAIAVGASASYSPLTLPVYSAFSIVGVVVGYLGWRRVRSRAHNPKATLSWLVPVLLVASFVPDVILLVTGFIPGTTLAGAVGLMIMHVIVAAVVVPVAAKLAPVS